MLHVSHSKRLKGIKVQSFVFHVFATGTFILFSDFKQQHSLIGAHKNTPHTAFIFNPGLNSSQKNQASHASDLGPGYLMLTNPLLSQHQKPQSYTSSVSLEQ